MPEKFSITDEYGNILEGELFEGRARIITDAGKLPQGTPVWLSVGQVQELVVELTVMVRDEEGESLSVVKENPQEPLDKPGKLE